MRKKMLFGIIFLAAITIYAQESVNHIELLGKGVAGMEEATIPIPDWENIDYIIAEAVYACGMAPGEVRFSTDSETKTVAPQLIPCGVEGNAGLITSVFKTRFEVPTTQVSLDILENNTRFRSFSLFLHRKGGNIQSIQAGELVHIYKKEKIPQLAELNVPVSINSRDINLKFGVTELKDDNLVAVFTFESNGEVLKTEIRSWFKNGEIDAYYIHEILFEDVPGKVNRICMTMFSTEDRGDSFIAGSVLADIHDRGSQLLRSIASP